MSRSTRALAACAIVAISCGGGAPPSAAPIVRVFVDDSGETIARAPVPRRVVALAPSLVEIVAAVGCETSLVGVSSYSDHPPRVRALPIAGSYVKPNIEAVVSLRPDLVLVVLEGPPKESVARMRALGLRVAVLRSSRVADIPRNVRAIGSLLDAGSRAEAEAARIERRYAAVRAAVADRPRPKVLYAIALDPVITAGRTSFIHDLISDAGGENAAGDLNDPYPRLSLEAILDRAPEIVLFGAEGMGGEAAAGAQRGFWKRWSSLPAVRDGRLLEVERDLVNRPSPRIAASLAHLAGLLHPERSEAIEEALAIP